MKLKGQQSKPGTALGGWQAGTRPTTQVTVLSVPESCLCAWDMHGERDEEGFYTGLYWFILKYRHRECEAKRAGLHK